MLLLKILNQKLEEYRTAYLKRKEIIDNLFDEIKTIKKTKPAYSGGFVSYYAIAILAIIVGVVVIILAF